MSFLYHVKSASLCSWNSGLTTNILALASLESLLTPGIILDGARQKYPVFSAVMCSVLIVPYTLAY